MKTIQIPYEPDVIAISAGAAGSSAAVAAARRGFKVLVLEEGNCFGGCGWGVHHVSYKRN